MSGVDPPKSPTVRGSGATPKVPNRNPSPVRQTRCSSQITNVATLRIIGRAPAPRSFPGRLDSDPRCRCSSEQRRRLSRLIVRIDPDRSKKTSSVLDRVTYLLKQNCNDRQSLDRSAYMPNIIAQTGIINHTTALYGSLNSTFEIVVLGSDKYVITYGAGNDWNYTPGSGYDIRAEIWNTNGTLAVSHFFHSLNPRWRPARFVGH